MTFPDASVVTPMVPEPLTGTMMGVVGKGLTGVTVTYSPDARSLTKSEPPKFGSALATVNVVVVLPPVVVEFVEREADALREVAVLVECDTLEPAERGGDGSERQVVDRTAPREGGRRDAAADQELARRSPGHRYNPVSPESSRRPAYRNR